MKAIIFLGPSLPLSAAESILHADYRPPVARGDVYRAALECPWGIGIVDGYFERVPAVWHKEILWAMSRGIHVFGASSMGALRAAELHSFGMVGVGHVFEAFHAGKLRDDDEVTIAHADASAQYQAASVAMVDIRATLVGAHEAGVIDAEQASQLLAIAKSTYYADRSYLQLCKAARMQSVDPAAVDRFEGFWPAHQVHIKREDAVQLLEHMRDRAQREPGPKQVSFAFEHTDAFEQFQRIERAEARRSASNEIVDELRLDPELYSQTAARGWGRVLGAELANRLHITTEEATYRSAVAELRQRHGLERAADVHAWLASNQLDRGELEAMVRAETRSSVVRKLFAGALDDAIVAELRSSGVYPRLAARVRHKRSVLEQHGRNDPDLESCGLREPFLFDWYMHEIGATNSPEHVMALCVRLDSTDRHALLRRIMREYLYRALTRVDPREPRATPETLEAVEQGE